MSRRSITINRQAGKPITPKVAETYRLLAACITRLVNAGHLTRNPENCDSCRNEKRSIEGYLQAIESYRAADED